MKRRNIFIYLAHKYTAPTDKEMESNVQHAALLNAALVDLGFSVFDPLNNSHNASKLTTKTRYKHWLEMDFEIIRRCDCVFMPLGYYETSKGCNMELKYAYAIGKPIVYTIDELMAKYAIINK